ncbi:MAG: aspartate/glutamate racemase family protein [Pseudomonadota bacterium]
MGVVIINPNSTASMTDAMVEVARASAPELSFDGWTSENGPPAIQGFEDGKAAAPHLLELVRKASNAGADGIIIGCFDDTALSQAAALASCPVIGIGHATFHFSALRNWRFSVVTTMPASVPVIEGNIADFGLTGFSSKVRASHVPVLDLENAADASEGLVVEEAKRAEAEDDVDAVILGCAGMVTLSHRVEAALSKTVLDPVSVSASCMKWLV